MTRCPQCGKPAQMLLSFALNTPGVCARCWYASGNRTDPVGPPAEPRDAEVRR